MGILDIPGISRMQADVRYKRPNLLRTVAALGDSWTALNSSLSPGQFNPPEATALSSETYGHSILSWACGISGNRLQQAYIGGFSGQTSIYILANSAATLASGADFLVELCGINDINQYATVYGGDLVAAENGVVANRQAIWDAAVTKGMTVIAMAIPPVGALPGFTSNQQKVVYRVNARLKAAAAGRKNVTWLDINTLGMDFTSITAQPIAGLLVDTLHPMARYSYIIGKALSDVMTPLTAPYVPRPSSYYDSIDQDTSSSNLLPARFGLFIDGTAGAIGTGTTGTVATGWLSDKGQSGGSPSAVASIINAASGRGKAQRLVITSTSANEYIRLKYTSNNPSIVAGQSAYAEFTVDISAATNFLVPRGQLRANYTLGGAQSITSYVLSPRSNDTGPQDGTMSFVLRTPLVWIPSGATGITSFEFEMQFSFAGSGGATVDVSSCSLIKA